MVLTKQRLSETPGIESRLGAGWSVTHIRALCILVCLGVVSMGTDKKTLEAVKPSSIWHQGAGPNPLLSLSYPLSLFLLFGL